jgi:hypothetical protein
MVWANSHHTASRPIGADRPSFTQLYTPPGQPEASSAATSDTGTRNTSAGSTYKATEASPRTASGGVEPRFPTDPTVSKASAVHVMKRGFAAGAGTVGDAAAKARGRRRLRSNMWGPQEGLGASGNVLHGAGSTG